MAIGAVDLDIRLVNHGWGVSASQVAVLVGMDAPCDLGLHWFEGGNVCGEAFREEGEGALFDEADFLAELLDGRLAGIGDGAAFPVGKVIGGGGAADGIAGEEGGGGVKDGALPVGLGDDGGAVIAVVAGAGFGGEGSRDVAGGVWGIWERRWARGG